VLFILAKSSRSPLKKLQDRVIPTAGISNGSRSPSPQGGGDQDQWPPPPGLGDAARERIERREGLNSPPPPSRTGQEFDDSKEAERPAGDRGLPSVSTPGAMEGVNFGDGSQASKDAREKSARRRREQQRAREEAGTYQRPTLDNADQLHVALLTPLKPLCPDTFFGGYLVVVGVCVGVLFDWQRIHASRRVCVCVCECMRCAPGVRMRCAPATWEMPHVS
jgi:hypothetical protein